MRQRKETIHLHAVTPHLAHAIIKFDAYIPFTLKKTNDRTKQKRMRIRNRTIGRTKGGCDGDVG